MSLSSTHTHTHTHTHNVLFLGNQTKQSSLVLHSLNDDLIRANCERFPITHEANPGFTKDTQST